MARTQYTAWNSIFEGTASASTWGELYDMKLSQNELLLALALTALTIHEQCGLKGDALPYPCSIIQFKWLAFADSMVQQLEGAERLTLCILLDSCLTDLAVLRGMMVESGSSGGGRTDRIAGDTLLQDLDAGMRGMARPHESEATVDVRAEDVAAMIREHLGPSLETTRPDGGLAAQPSQAMTAEALAVSAELAIRLPIRSRHNT